MYKGITIKPPFFEIGPKAYLYGEEMLALARVIDRVAIKYDVDIIDTSICGHKVVSGKYRKNFGICTTYGLSETRKGAWVSVAGGCESRRCKRRDVKSRRM